MGNIKMETGFVPALGTPLDAEGNLIPASYAKQIERMLDEGAVGLLCMGSMGQQAFLRNEVCVQAAENAVKAAGGRVPVYVGAMDNSILRAKQRMATMEHLALTAFVFTTPYYEIDSDNEILHYFEQIGASTKHSIILYDLPYVTNHKITYEMVHRLRQTMPNLMGIKSADLYMLRKLRLNPDMQDFRIFYSGLDAFDIAYPWGIGSILDGMFSCTPANTGKLIRALDAGDRESAAKYLNNIIGLRDLFAEKELWSSYSAAMNLLGYEGSHAPDWAIPVPEQTERMIRDQMKRIGELA